MTEDELLQPNTYRDSLSTVTQEGKRNWIYALKPSGKFYNIRSVFASLYLVLFFVLPFVKYNDRPFILLNVTKGEFILFGKVFWPQDFFIFAIGMVAFVIFIVLFTIIFGRLFCGWACPQTIFMEFIFRKIEWWIEGTPTQQIALNKSEWNANKIIKKVSKHVIFILASLLIAHTFLSYILGVDEVQKIIHEPLKDHLGLFFGILGFTFLFYAVYAFVRDIVCTTVCPYGRLQGVMFDKNTMQIAYDYTRGEPRGHLKKDSEPKGDCIDCGKCVRVCPTGIDIRNGVQLDCVNCTACIDACNEIMTKINKPTGLIRYASENELSQGTKFTFTTRAKAYMVVLLLLLGLMATLIATRKSVEMYIYRTKGQLYTEANGYLINMYEAKIYNKSSKAIPASLQLENYKGELEIIGTQNLVLKKEAINQLVILIKIPTAEIKKHSTNLNIGVYANGEKIQTAHTKFLGPYN